MTDQLSQVFAALADPTRRDMVTRLCAGDATVGELAAPYDVSMQAVSKHLKVLETAGLVSREREAQRRPVHLEAEVFDLMTKWIERYRQEAEERYQRLDAVLAAMDETRQHQWENHQGRTSIMSTTMKTADGTTTIEADPNLPLVKMTRDFRATPAQLVRAHTDPELFVQWIGPNGMDTRLEHWDARTGGSWRYVSTRGDEEYPFHGSFHEVRDDRIVQTFTYDDYPDGVSLETMWFEDLGDGRTRMHSTSLVDSLEARDMILSSGMEVGINDGYAKLDRLLEDGAV